MKERPSDSAQEIAAHLALALKVHCRQLRREGIPVPPGLETFGRRLVETVTSGQEESNIVFGATPGASSESMTATAPFPLPKAADALGISLSTLRRRIRSGDINPTRIGRRVFVCQPELNRILSPEETK